jgi:RNA recognition motif-containing protein
MNIYVGNLNYRVKESDLQKAMEDYGTVSSVKFINDRTTGRFRGIAFVEMEAKAIAELDGAEFFGRQMVVKEARPPKY